MALTHLLNIIRVALLPLLIWLVYQDSSFGYQLTTLILVLVLFSYYLEGSFLKTKKTKRLIGSFLEPFTDKLIVVGLLFVFFLQGSFHWIFLLIFILRDIVVSLIRWYASKEDVLFGGEFFAKILITAQFGIIFSILSEQIILQEKSFMWLFITERAYVLFILFAVLIAVGSMIVYLLVYLRKLSSRKKLGWKFKQGNMVILANRKSRGYHDGYRRRLLKIFARRRKADLIFLPKNKNMFKGIETDLRVRKAKVIVIAGGDGSFESALNYKYFEHKILGFFPLGAGNAFYSYFYRGKRFEYLRSRFKFRAMEQDVLELEWEKGKVCTLFSAIGTDAEVPRLTGEQRTQHGFFDYLKAIWKGVFTVKADYNFETKIDSRKRKLRNCPNITFGKVPYYGYAIRTLVGKVKSDDGFIYGLACVNAHSIFLSKIVRIWGLIITALGVYKPPMLKLRGKNMLIKSKVPFPIQVGGEFLGYSNHLKIKVKRKQRVLVI